MTDLQTRRAGLSASAELLVGYGVADLTPSSIRVTMPTMPNMVVVGQTGLTGVAHIRRSAG